MKEKNKPKVRPIKIPIKGEEVILDELILNYPFDFRTSYLWHLLKARGLLHQCCCNCCNCCCGHGHHHVHRPAPAPAPAPAIQVSLNAMGYSLVVGGSIYNARVELDWNATGASNLRVDLQVRSQLAIGSYPNWTTIYPNRPASGRVAWPAAARPGERLEFRAVARESAGNQGVSNTVTV